MDVIVNNEIMVTVPLKDFVDCVKARADLDSICAIIKDVCGYSSADVRVILGIFSEEGTNAGTD